MKLAIVDDNKLEQELIFNTLRTYEHERNISLDILLIVMVILF